MITIASTCNTLIQEGQKKEFNRSCFLLPEEKRVFLRVRDKAITQISAQPITGNERRKASDGLPLLLNSAKTSSAYTFTLKREGTL